MPRQVKCSESLASSGAPLGKRSSSSLIRSDNTSSEDDNDLLLVKKFRSELNIADNRSCRRLKNITNTVDQLPAAEVVEVARKKRKVGPKKDDSREETDRRTPKCAKVAGEDREVIDESKEKLRYVLGKHYFDVGNRVSLYHVPGCLKNVDRCEKLHAQRANQARRVNQRIQQDTKELLIENRPMHFLDYLEQAMLRNEFIDSQLFIKALELALTINEPSDQLKVDYSVRSLLEQIADILDRTVDQFPPCWLDLKRAYHGIMFGKLEEDCFAKYDRSEGLFKVVIFLLERCVESVRGKCRSVNDVSRTMTIKERSMANYYLWEQENNQKYDYDLLERDDKLERLFLVLQILVKILESDLTMWILRHPHNVKENMIHPSRKPLIASLLWHEHSNVGEVNSLIKRIIALNVNVTAVRYPEDIIQTLSRLVSLTGTAINLTEIQYDGTIEYPCIKDNTRYFSHQIWRHLDASNYYSVSLCLRSIEQMRSPLLRMILASDFIRKLTLQQADAPCVAFYLKHLVEGKWKEFRSDNPPEPVSPRDRFPFLDKRKQRKVAHDIGQPQFVELLLVAFRAYMEVFSLKSYFQNLKSPSEPQASRSPTRSGRKSTDLVETRRNPIDFETMEKNINNLSRSFVRTETTIVRHSAEGPTSVPLMLEEISVTKTLMLRYRDDVKHLLLIKRWLQTKASAREEYRILFKPWRSYLATVDETLVCE
ncbi:uncharacterized protein LOC135709673 [Ochlerotatus camptorhynchus]|uniref:uncharacterized protein LOC135709673 n=1 Tax=Ochlerotatus camptorhynchus TaxID=644619 RepID=UPI0031DC9A8D